MEAILSNSTRKLLWFEITKKLTAVYEKKLLSFIIIFGTLSFRIAIHVSRRLRYDTMRDDILMCAQKPNESA